MDMKNPKEQISDGSTASYYELPAGATDLQDLISHRNMNSQIGEIFRACYRYGIVSHSDMLRDAKKIKFYAEAEIKRLEKLNKETQEAAACLTLGLISKWDKDLKELPAATTLPPLEEFILNLIKQTPGGYHYDQLCRIVSREGYSTAGLSSILDKYIVEGRVHKTPGSRYTIIPQMKAGRDFNQD